MQLIYNPDRYDELVLEIKEEVNLMTESMRSKLWRSPEDMVREWEESVWWIRNRCEEDVGLNKSDRKVFRLFCDKTYRRLWEWRRVNWPQFGDEYLESL